MDLLGALRRGWTDARPAGLGALLAGGRPTPSRSTAPPTPCAAMADACARDDRGRAAAAAAPLLGLGPGLTPSGDDFVGGALFARRVLRRRPSRRGAAAASLVERARSRTHPDQRGAARRSGRRARATRPSTISSTRWPTARADEPWRAVARLGRLGHSSGWDMLTGVLVGLAGPAALDSRPVRVSEERAASASPPIPLEVQ